MKLEVVVNRFGKNLHLKCVANVTHPVSFLWKFNNQTFSENQTVKIECTDRSSQLILRNVRTHNSGTYKCVVR